MYVYYVLDENFVKNMYINYELLYVKNEGKLSFFYCNIFYR